MDLRRWIAVASLACAANLSIACGGAASDTDDEQGASSAITSGDAPSSERTCQSKAGWHSSQASVSDTVVFVHAGALLKDNAELVRLVATTLVRRGFAGVRAPDDKSSDFGPGIEYFDASESDNAELVRSQINAVIAATAPDVASLKTSCIPETASDGDRTPTHVHVWLR